jgi:hypothetical protein
MDREQAAKLADTILGGTDPETSAKLRMMLVETFASMEQPGATLVASAGGLKAYLLCPPSLLIAHISTQQSSVDFHSVDLTQVTLTRSCHDAEGAAESGSWTTTWRLSNEHIKEEFVGREGPSTAEDVGLFAGAVARAAGWPLVAAGSS